MDGDREAFTLWARQARGGLLRLAFLLTGDHHRAEDLVQEALIKVAVRWRRLHAEHPAAYARQVIVRDNISWWRRHRREQVASPEPPPSGTGEPGVDRRVVLARALDRLTPGQRAVVVLRYYHDLTERQTADTMRVSIGTVKSQAHHALRRLREQAPELAELLQEIP